MSHGPKGHLSTPPFLLLGEHQLGLSWQAFLPGMVKQLADSFHSGRDDKYSHIIAVRICGDNKIAWPFWVIVQQRGPNHHFTICKCHLQLQARRALSLNIKIPLLKPRIPMKVPNHKHGLQALHRYLKRPAGEVVSRGKIEEILVGREILHEAPGDGSIGISDNHLSRFHFLHPVRKPRCLPRVKLHFYRGLQRG